MACHRVVYHKMETLSYLSSYITVRLWYVATKGLSVYCLQKGTVTISYNSFTVKKVLVTLTIFWLPQLHSFCVRDT